MSAENVVIDANILDDFDNVEEEAQRLKQMQQDDVTEVEEIQVQETQTESSAQPMVPGDEPLMLVTNSGAVVSLRLDLVDQEMLASFNVDANQDQRVKNPWVLATARGLEKLRFTFIVLPEQNISEEQKALQPDPVNPAVQINVLEPFSKGDGEERGYMRRNLRGFLSGLHAVHELTQYPINLTDTESNVQDSLRNISSTLTDVVLNALPIYPGMVQPRITCNSVRVDFLRQYSTTVDLILYVRKSGLLSPEQLSKQISTLASKIAPKGGFLGGAEIIYNIAVPIETVAESINDADTVWQGKHEGVELLSVVTTQQAQELENCTGIATKKARREIFGGPNKEEVAAHMVYSFKI